MASSISPHRKASETLIHLLIKNLTEIKDSTGEFLLRLPDGRVIDTKGWGGWEWTHGIGLYGIYRFHQQTGGAKSLQIIEQWFKDRFEEGTPHKNVNTFAAFLTLAYVYEETREPTYLPYLEAWAEWAMKAMPRTEEDGMQHCTYVSPHEGQLWDDTLMMTVLPLAKIGKILNRDSYVREAEKQVLIHIKYLVDRKTGLWFHGWNFNGRHHFANALWGRGNAWFTIFAPEFLELLYASHPSPPPVAAFITSALTSQLRALLALQDPTTGLFHTLLDDKTSYLEASASAGFAFGMLAAVRKGIVSGDFAKDVETAGVKALQGVVAEIDKTSGELGKVSFGTPVCGTLQGYKDIREMAPAALSWVLPLTLTLYPKACTSMPYGQAMAMLAIVEWSKRFL